MTASEAPAQISFADLIGSLTGYEEDKIANRFGDLAGLSLSKTSRALLFVSAMRDGANEAAAHKQAMDLTLKAVNDRFFSEDEDADDVYPEEPDTDQGKGDSPSE